MTSSRATIIYDVWAFHSTLADTGITQAGVVLLHGSGNAAENDYHLCIYHTSRDPSQQHISYMRSQQCPLGGNMIYKGKIFGADMEPFNAICRSVEPIATNLGIPLNSATDWIEIWEDHMNRKDIAQILFDRPEKRPLEYFSPISYVRSQHELPPTYYFESADWNGIAYKPQRDTPPHRHTYRASRTPPSYRERHHLRRRGSFRELESESESESSDDGFDCSSEEDESHEPRRDRRSSRKKYYKRDDESNKRQPESKKLKYAGVIAETVTANAIGDIFGLAFESVIGAIL